MFRDKGVGGIFEVLLVGAHGYEEGGGYGGGEEEEDEGDGGLEEGHVD